MSRLDDFIKQKQTRIEIMEGREREDLKSLLEKEIHINDFDFLSGDDGVYGVFTIAEDDKSFYFASSVITELLQGLEKEGLKEEVKSTPLGIKLQERKSKSSKRNYIAYEFIQE